MSSGLPAMQPRLIMGLNTKIEGNAQFVTDDEIIYPVGSVLALHNIHQKKQKYIRFAEKGRNVTAVLISPNKKLVAITESGERPIVTLYCPVTYKKKRSLVIPSDIEVSANKYVACAFTFDSKYLLCVSGEPEFMMYCFKCDKGRMESNARANNTNGSGVVRQIATNPNDINQVGIVGEGLMRFLGCSDYVWRQFGYSKNEGVDFTSAVWLSQERFMAGTIDGKLVIFESGELRNIFHAKDLPIINLKLSDEFQQSSSEQVLAKITVSEIFEGENVKVTSLINFPRGFAFAHRNGTIHLYERETPHKFKKRNVFRIPDHTIEREFGDYEAQGGVYMTAVHCISINPAQDRLLVTCGEKQIYSVRLWIQDSNANSETPLSEYGPLLHNGPVGSIAVCSWKPIILTAGERDRTLMIWNYESEELELIQKFQDDVFAVSLHPSGLYCTVGFSDKLRFITIMIDEFMTTREFPIRACRFCSFSRMGQYFAAANGNVIQLYSTISFELMYVFKGHNGKIRGMSWSQDDMKLVSCGSEGAVYEWCIYEAKRAAELVIKTCPFNGVTVTGDGKSSFAVGEDGHVRELMNGNVYRDVTMVSGAQMDDVVLSHLDTMLFVAGNSGTVYSVKLPLMEKAEYMEFVMHAAPVSKMLISYDDRFIITADMAGTICIWRLLNIEGKAIKMDKDFKPSTEILIARLILEDKLTQIKDLKLRMHELETEHAYQLRQNDVIHSLRMKDIHAGYCSAIEELKEKNENMEAEHMQEINNINLDIAKMKTNHEAFVQKLEANYNEKLIFEYEKYQRLEEKMEKMRKNYEQELDDLRQAKKDSEDAITNDFLEQLQDKQVQYDELVERAKQKSKEHELIKEQIEDDADREIYEMKTTFGKELKEEQDLNVRIRGEITMVKKKLMASQKEIDDLMHHVYTLESEQVKLKAVIINLEKDIADLKKEISERDATIQDKEKRIFELKSKNQELEKFKFILDFKIKELKSQIEPRERTIKEQIEQINEMVNELESLQKVILALDLQVAELKEKLSASGQEVKKEIEKNRRMKDILKTIRTDIHLASGYIQNTPMLIKCVRDMYHKYNADKDFSISHSEDVEAKSEFLRQREFLERTVATLQQQASKGTSSLSYDKVRLIEENAELLMETNDLRKDLKHEKRDNKKLQSILGFSRKYIPPKVAAEKLNRATSSRQEIHELYQAKIEENEKVINAMREENNRLLGKIAEDYFEEEVPEEAPNEDYN